ncbi:predicted protein [Postia placenta Mad-698-R]|nr:predicted protein [Postia placenta Mad-698-R]
MAAVKTCESIRWWMHPSQICDGHPGDSRLQQTTRVNVDVRKVTIKVGAYEGRHRVNPLVVLSLVSMLLPAARVIRASHPRFCARSSVCGVSFVKMANGLNPTYAPQLQPAIAVSALESTLVSTDAQEQPR